ncbi:endonuclease-reverse transcriptase [Elysia marginata]|uniref:Endonuclease-reverse transcriptase n=1 Tax=Elysia marginata TaxID=1093978 RepID=A0AAV4IUK5_9GAST|nr:endonuclease-reverse transcriptase [Elysia marginata]
MKIDTKSNSDVLIDGKSVESVKGYTYLESYLTADGNIKGEISARVVMAFTAFHKLNAIWKSNRVKGDTKLKLHTSNVRSVLLYASKTFGTNQRIKRPPRIPHRFVDVSLVRPSLCIYCNDFIWGKTHPGKLCEGEHNNYLDCLRSFCI